MLARILTLAVAVMLLATQARASDEADNEFLLARKLKLEHGDYDMAAGKFEDFLKKYPTHKLAGEAMVELGECYMETKRQEAALQIYAKFLTSYPQADESLRRAAMLNCGHANLWLKHPDRAIESYTQLLQAYPASPLAEDALRWRGESYLTLARSASADGDAANASAFYDKAAEDFSAYLKRYPESKSLPAALPGAGEALLGKGDLAGAVAAYARMVNEFKQSEGADLCQLRIGDCYYAGKDYAKAAAAYQAVPSLFPKSKYLAAARSGAAWCDYAAGEQMEAGGDAVGAQAKFGTAGAGFAAAAAFSKDDTTRAAQSNYEAGWAYRRAGDLTRAVAYMSAAAGVEGAPIRGAALFNLGSFRLEQSRVEGLDAAARGQYLAQARDYLARAAADATIGSRAPEASTFLGEACLDARDYAAAAKAFAAVTEKYPDDERAPWALYHMALALREDSKASETAGDAAGAKERTGAAKDALQKLFMKYSNSRLRLQAAFAMADYQSYLGETDKSRGAYGWVAEKGVAWASEWKDASGKGDAELVAEAKRLASESLFCLGESYFPADCAKAGEYYKSLLQNYPGSKREDGARLRLAEIADRAKDYAGAEQQYQAVLVAAKDPEVAKTALYNLAILKFLSAQAKGGDGKTAATDAVGLFDRFLAAYGKDELAGKAQFYRAEALYFLGDKGRALEGYKAAQALYGKERKDEIYSGMAWCLKDLSEIASGQAEGLDGAAKTAMQEKSRQYCGSARQYFEALVKQYPDSPRRAESLYALALCQQELGQLEAAAKSAGEVLSSYPASDRAPWAAVLRARVLAESGDRAGALAALDAFERDYLAKADNPDLLYSLSWAWRKLVDPALQEAEAAADACRNGGDGATAEQTKKRDELVAAARALEDRMAAPLRLLAEKFPAYSNAGVVLIRLGEIAYDRKDYAAALENYRKAITADKGGSVADKAQYRVAWSLLMLATDLERSAAAAGDAKQNAELSAQAAARKTEAATEFEKLGREYPQSEFADEGCFRAGELRRAAGDAKGALPLFQQVVAKYPKGKFAANAAFGAGACKLDTGDYRGALEDFKAMLAAFPNGDAARDALWGAGHACFTLGAYQDARGYFEKALDGDYAGEAAAKSRFGLGMIEMEQGNWEKAREEFIKVDAFYSQWRQWASLALLKSAQASRKLAEQNQGGLDRSRKDLQVLLKRYPYSPAAKEAEQMLKEIGE